MNSAFQPQENQEFCVVVNHQVQTKSSPSSKKPNGSNAQAVDETGGEVTLAGNLTDEDLIKAFVNGETKFLYSKELQLDSSLRMISLRKRSNSELIGLLKPGEKIKSVLIKQDSTYGKELHKILLDNKFLPFGESKQQKGLFEYHQHDVPNGYKINYTEARLLWKAWWPTQRNQSNWSLKLDILVLKDTKWYPIKDIILQEGGVYIKSLVHEMTLGANDKIVWLQKIENENENENNPEAIVEQTKRNVEVKSSKESKLEQETSKLAPPVALTALESKAMQALEDYLVNGETETQVEVIKNLKGEIISYKSVIIKKPCPSWVFEYLISKKTSESASSTSTEYYQTPLNNNYFSTDSHSQDAAWSEEAR